MRGTRAALYVLFTAACAPVAASAPPSSGPTPEIAFVSDVKAASRASAPSSELLMAIAAAVTSAAPSPALVPDEPYKPDKPEGHLAHPVCLGPVDLKKERPHTASCCYPAKDVLVAPIRAAYPTLRACYDARKNKNAEGRVVFDFRIEQDGSIQRVCTGDATSVDDEDAVRCMVERIRKLRFAAMSDAELDLCGHITLHYPVVFEP